MFSISALSCACLSAVVKIVNDDLIINPQDRMFSLLGTKVHGTLERHTDNMLSEERIFDEVSSGQMTVTMRIV